MSEQLYRFRNPAHRHMQADGGFVEGGQAFTPTTAELQAFGDLLIPASPAPAVEIQVEAEAPDGLPDTANKTIDEVMLLVADGTWSPQAALEAEQARGSKARKTLLDELEGLL